MQEEVHPGDGRSGEVTFLPVELAEEGTWIAATGGRVRRQLEHLTGATRDRRRSPLLWIEDAHHQLARRCGGVEFPGFAIGGVGELLDEVFVGITNDVAGHTLIAQGQRGEVFDEVFEQWVGQAVFVAPLRIAEDAVEVFLVSRLDAAQRILQRRADVSRRLTDDVPVTIFGNLEAVVFGVVLAVGLDHVGVFLVPHIADALEEEQRQDVALPVGTIHGFRAGCWRPPKGGIELGKGDCLVKELGWVICMLCLPLSIEFKTHPCQARYPTAEPILDGRCPDGAHGRQPSTLLW